MSSSLPAGRPQFAGYLFCYFTGEGQADGEQIYFALSQGNDPLHWRPLNDARPVLRSTTGSTGLRDPFLVRSPRGDRFYLLATDLKIHGNGDWDAAQRTGSRSIMVWESADLVHWSDQRAVPVAPPNAGNAWAPEAFYDPALGAYLVFWASTRYADDDPDHTGATHHRMLYATTHDFRTFSPPQVWHDPGHSVIDCTVLEHDGVYHRFTKDERGSFIVQERAAGLRDRRYELVAERIGAEAMSHGEGPLVFKSNTGDRWHLFIDEYGGRGYLPFESTDPDSGEWVPSSDYRLPAGARHGGVLPITQPEYDRLLAAYRPATGPVLPGRYADPNIAVFGDTFYIYPTTDGYADWAATRFHAFSSTNLRDWTDRGVIFDLETDLSWAGERAWAPAVAEKDGTFYFYFCADTNIGVAVADSPTGPFRDALGKPLVAAGAFAGQMIDPAVFTDDDGQSYLYWGNGHGYVVKLNDDMVSFDSAQVADITPNGFREGAFVVKRDGVYYYMWSENDTGDPDYQVAYATGPTPYGPFTERGVILSKRPERGILGTGHHTVIRVPGTDDWYIAYHRFAIPDGNGFNRESTIDRLVFNADGSIAPVVPTLESVAPLAPSLTASASTATEEP